VHAVPPDRERCLRDRDVDAPAGIYDPLNGAMHRRRLRGVAGAEGTDLVPSGAAAAKKVDVDLFAFQGLLYRAMAVGELAKHPLRCASWQEQIPPAVLRLLGGGGDLGATMLEWPCRPQRRQRRVTGGPLLAGRRALGDAAAAGLAAPRGEEEQGGKVVPHRVSFKSDATFG
jgi:hypothetical protein